MAATYIQGNLINLFYHNGTSWVTFAYTQNNSLSYTNETTSISSKDHGLHPDTAVTGSSFTLSGEVYFTSNNADIMAEMANAAKPYSFAFAKVDQTDYAAGLKDVTGDTNGAAAWTITSAPWIRYGSGIVTSFSITANNGEVATVSLEITGSGALSDTAPTTPISYTTESA